MLKNPVVVENHEASKGTAIRAPVLPPIKKSMVGRAGPDNRHFSSKRDQGLQERDYVMDERKISELFAGYFHNKMTLLLFLVQAKQLKPNPVLISTVHNFLSDLFRHMLDERLQKRYRLLFKWLMRFFERLPAVSVAQRDTAKEYIRAIYDALGLHLKEDL